MRDTNEDLRTRLFEVMDLLVKGEISLDRVEGMCALSDRVLLETRLRYDLSKAELRSDTARSDRLLTYDVEVDDE